MTKKELEKLLSAFSSGDAGINLDLLRFNKKLRTGNLTLKGRRVQFPNVPINAIGKSPQELVGLIDKFLGKSDYPFKTFDSLYRSLGFLDIPFLSKFQIDVQKLSAICDIVGFTSEKLDKKTAFQSIVNDQAHLAHGLRCTCIISEDKNLLTKARFIRKMRQLPVEAFDIDSFVTDMLKRKFRHEHPSTTEQSGKSILYTFADEKGNLLREYRIAFD